MAVGVVCSAASAMIGGAIWGPAGAIAAGSLGLIATSVQLVAAAVTTRMVDGPSPGPDQMAGYGFGMMLRLVGVVMLGLVMALGRPRLPPVACATGYLATVLPLLYLETRLGR